MGSRKRKWMSERKTNPLVSNVSFLLEVFPRLCEEHSAITPDCYHVNPFCTRVSFEDGTDFFFFLLKDLAFFLVINTSTKDFLIFGKGHFPNILFYSVSRLQNIYSVYIYIYHCESTHNLDASYRDTVVIPSLHQVSAHCNAIVK